MAQLLVSFHSSRYPAQPADTARKFNAVKNNHIAFVRKNKFFEVPLVHNGVELSEAELQVYVFMHLLCTILFFHSATSSQIERVIQLAGDEPGVPIGALTSQDRDVWTKVNP